MFRKTWFILLINSFISIAVANDAILRGLYDSQQSASSSSVGPNAAPVLGNATSMQTSQSCNVEDQNSLPLKFVMGLLRDRGSSLVPSHNSSTGELTVYGGRMIGNCNSMLDYVISPPADGLPYVFQVKIKACGSPTCAYRVRTMENGSPVQVEPTPSFEPNMRGFEACLKATGVINDNDQVVQDKIVNEEFKATVRGVTESSNLWFASHGPMQSQVYGSGGNLRTGHGCFYFENIQEDGFQVYSRADVERNRAQEEFQSVCNSRNYRLIDERISDFDQFGSLQDLLIAARDRLLLEKYGRLHSILNVNDFSEVNVEDVSQTISDFNAYILEPLQNEIREKYREVANSSGQVRRARQAELDALVDRFRSYAVAPYPTSGDLRKMQMFENSAPLDDESWANSILTLNRIQNTIAVYQQYKGNGQKQSPLIADRRILEAQGEFAREFAILRRLASDPDYSRVEELRRRSASLQQATQDSHIELQQDIQAEVAYIQRHCYGQYYIASNPISLRRCVSEAQENINSWQQETQNYTARNIRIAQELEREAQEWSRVEQRRGGSSGGRSSDQRQERNTPYTFNFQNQGIQRTGQGQTMMPSQMQPNFGYPAMWNQVQPNYGVNPNFYQGQYNMGFQNPQFASMQGRYPTQYGAPMMQQQPQPWQYGGFPSSPYNVNPGFTQGMQPVYANQMVSGQFNFGV